MGMLRKNVCYHVIAKIRFRRGRSGGQVRDEYRDEYDPGRGGFSRVFLSFRLQCYGR